MFDNQSILITCLTGSSGHAFVLLALAKYDPRRHVIFLHDEMK